MNLELVNRLIAHYKAMLPTEVEAMNWGWGKCAGGVLMDWKLVPYRSVSDIAAVLGIEYQPAYRLVYGIYQDGDIAVQGDGSRIHYIAISMLENLANTGNVAWPDADGNMR